MKLENYIDKRLEPVQETIKGLKKLLYGNGEERGMKVKLENIVAIRKHNRWLIGAFCVVLLAVMWSAGYWAFKVAVNQIVDERNAEIVEMINELDYKLNNMTIEIIEE